MYRKGCDLGNALGCMNLGSRYREGRGVPHDLALADRYLDKACRLDHADACHSQGQLVLARGGVAATAEARHLFQQACTLGSGWGCRAARDLGSTMNNPEAGRHPRGEGPAVAGVLSATRAWSCASRARTSAGRRSGAQGWRPSARR
jgi:TPR repeat protein